MSTNKVRLTTQVQGILPIANGGSNTFQSVNQTAHGFAVGDVLKETSTANTYAKAQADSAANAEVVGIVTTVTDVDNFIYTAYGIITAGVPTATAGTVYFLDPSTAGAMTSTEPTTANQVSKPLLVVLQSATRALFYNLRGDVIVPQTFTGKQTMWVSASALRPTVSNGSSTVLDTETTSGHPDLNQMAFSGTVDQYAQFPIAFPKQWDNGTVTFQPIWTGLVAGAGDVVWSLQGVATSDGDTIDVAYGTAVNVTDTFQSVNTNHTTAESSAVTIAGSPTTGDLTYFRFARLATNGGDTRTQPANLLGLRLFYTTNATNDS